MYEYFDKWWCYRYIVIISYYNDDFWFWIKKIIYDCNEYDRVNNY